MCSEVPDRVVELAKGGPGPGANNEPAVETGNNASVYEEQKRLENQEADRLLDATIDVSGDTSGEDEIPEEILLNSSTESGGVPVTAAAITTNSDMAKPKQSNSIATHSESNIAGKIVPAPDI